MLQVVCTTTVLVYSCNHVTALFREPWLDNLAPWFWSFYMILGGEVQLLLLYPVFIVLHT